MQHPKFQILLVEDDDVFVEALSRTLNRLTIPYQLHVYKDGEQALTAMRELNGAIQHWLPCIMLLDLTLPGMTGTELLERMRKDPLLRTVVVFVLTLSNADADITAAYDLGVAGYIGKHRLALDDQHFVDLLEAYYAAVAWPDV